jgi:hypothetical protein
VWSTYLPRKEAIDISIMCHRQDLSGATNSKSISGAYLWAAGSDVQEMSNSASTLRNNDDLLDPFAGLPTDADGRLLPGTLRKFAPGQPG